MSLTSSKRSTSASYSDRRNVTVLASCAMGFGRFIDKPHDDAQCVRRSPSCAPCRSCRPRASHLGGRGIHLHPSAVSTTDGCGTARRQRLSACEEVRLNLAWACEQVLVLRQARSATP